MQSLINGFLLLQGDVVADRLRGALHRFGSHLKTGEQFDLLASVIERCLRTDQRQHAAHTGRALCFVDIQSGIGGKLTIMALRAQIPRALKLNLAYCSEYMASTHLAVTGFVSAGTGHFALFSVGRLEAQ